MVVAATGFFDGVHRGHQAVLQCLKGEAARRGASSAVITFWPHPRTVLQKDAARLRLLTSLDEKRQKVLEQGVDSFWVLPFTRDFARITTHEFFERFLKQQYGVDVLVAGYNHRLGKDAIHDALQMKRLAEDVGIEVIEVPEFTPEDGNRISSTKIRSALSDGLVTTANNWLGYAYTLHGVVVEGNRIGRTLGFPTANMRTYEPLKQLPCNGVYKVRAKIHDIWYNGMTNIGFRPTVANNLERTIETHIFDFDEDIYGLDLWVEFLDRLRPEITFSSLDALKEQLGKDKLFLIS